MYRYIENDKVAGKRCSVWWDFFQLDTQSKRLLPPHCGPKHNRASLLASQHSTRRVWGIGPRRFLGI